MGDEPYTNLDLDTADELLVAAGHPAIAKALRHQTQGNRNLIQGEWGMQVVTSFEKILKVQVVNVLASVQQTLDQQHDLVQQILASQKNAEKTARQALTVAKGVARGLGKIEQDMRELNERHAAQIKILSDDIAAIKGVMDARPQQRLEEQHRLEERLKAMEERLIALEAGGN